MPKHYVPTPEQLHLACMGHPLAEQALARGLLVGVAVQHLAALGKLSQYSLQTLERAKAKRVDATIWASGAVMLGKAVAITPAQRQVDIILANSCMTVRLQRQAPQSVAPKASLANPNCHPYAKAAAKLIKKVERKERKAKAAKYRKAAPALPW